MNRHSRPSPRGAPTTSAPRDASISEDGAGERHPTVVAGYRIVRTLAATGRADILLGHPRHVESGDTVAIKVYRADVDPESIGAEIAVMDGAAGAFLPALLDISTLPDGRVALVMERLSGDTIGSVLARRDRLEPGEAVTMLAPVTVALGVVHARGYTHTRLGPGTVSFDNSGRPLLTGLGSLRPLPVTGARRGGNEATNQGRLDMIRADYARLTALMRSVFDRLDPSGPHARRAEFLAAWFEGSTSAVPFTPCLDELERRLFEWAPAVPVRLSGDAARPDGVPGRIQIDVPSARAPGPMDSPPLDDGGTAVASTNPMPRPALLSLIPVPANLTGAVLRAGERVLAAQLMTRLRRGPAGRRAPALLAVCLAVSISVGALAVLPSVPEAATATRETSPPSARNSAPPQPNRGDADPVAAPDDASGVLDGAARDAVAGDDPVAAVPHLLAARAACVAAASVECFTHTDQAGSPLLAADRHAAGQSGERATALHGADYADHTAALVERSGNSALIVLSPKEGGIHSKPASLLVVKGEAGWRLREFFEAMDHPG